MKHLKVCVDARLVSGESGGVEQTVIGLAHGLSQLGDGDEEYYFLTYQDAADWLKPYLAGPCRILAAPSAPRAPAPGRPAGLRSLLRSLLRQGWHRFSPFLGEVAIPIANSDGTVERAGMELIHFAVPVAFRSALPSIYQFFDLQHRHLPENFTPRERLARDVHYRTFYEQAQLISAMTSWGKRDLVAQYGFPEQKIAVIPWAPVLSAYATPSEDDVSEAAARFRLPDRFMFYPAQTWPHKNHIGLLRALAILRDQQGLTVPLVCSGRQNAFYAQIERYAVELGLMEQIHFLGFVTELELRCLYRLCTALVFPSLFEGFGMPLLEAFLAGAPVASSNATVLPDVAGDAALLFDAGQPHEIAAAIARLWTDEQCRQGLRARGHARAAQFSWEQTARTFRAHYRRLAGRSLSNEDQALTAAPPIL